jgi:hypothetical protein
MERDSSSPLTFSAQNLIGNFLDGIRWKQPLTTRRFDNWRVDF